MSIPRLQPSFLPLADTAIDLLIYFLQSSSLFSFYLILTCTLLSNNRDIRKTLYLTHACVCGDLHGQTEPDNEDEDGHNPGGGGGGGGSEVPTLDALPSTVMGLPNLSPFADDLECWDLSLPELDEDPIRTSVNCYLSEGGALYPDVLPLDEDVADENFYQYVEPYLKAWRRKQRQADGLPPLADSDEDYTDYFPSEDSSSDDSDNDEGDHEYGTPRSLGLGTEAAADGIVASASDDSEGNW